MPSSVFERKIAKQEKNSNSKYTMNIDNDSGRGVQEWELMYTRGGFMFMYGKTTPYCKVKKEKRKKILKKK